jgi:CheY-like chemotaxis protein
VAGFEPVEAPDGAEALELARSEPPALVFLDIDLPGIDGYEVCRRLRAEPETALTTIAMLTAAAGEEAEREAEYSGADLFLTWLLHKAVSGKLLCARRDGRPSGWL